MFKKVMIDILTVKNGKDFDGGRVLGALVILAFLVFTAADIYFRHHFDCVNFGIAAGSIFAGVGINLKLKENTEPNDK